MNEPAFTMQQYLVDVEDNAKHFLSSRAPSFRDGAKLVAMVLSSEEVNASAVRTAKDQYLIGINTGLLKKFFELFDAIARRYYRRNALQLNISEELFFRMVSGVASEMIFWHEFAHLARGHLFYLKEQGLITNLELAERLHTASATGDSTDSRTWQFVEVDADIWGAQFLLSRLVVVLNSKANQVRPATFLVAYALGIRGAFEVLHREGYATHTEVQDGTHPHPLSRAYVALTHGLARAPDMGIPVHEAARWSVLAQAAFLDFELNELGMPVNVEVLEAFAATTLREWREQEHVLNPYQQLQAPLATWWGRLFGKKS